MSSMIYEVIAKKAKNVRADIAATSVDMWKSCGITIRRKGDSAKTLAELDEIIVLAEVQSATYQAGVAGVVPIFPSSGCASLSCDQLTP